MEKGGTVMLRGAKKNMIVVRTRDSRMFEEAYFVMRRDTGTAADEADMLWEANRILESTSHGVGREPAVRPVRSRLRGALWFMLGLVSGGGVTGLLWWIF
jgi:hypothetical protein